MVAWGDHAEQGAGGDWFGDPFWRIQTLAVLFVAGFVVLIVREMRAADPLVNFRTLKDGISVPAA